SVRHGTGPRDGAGRTARTRRRDRGRPGYGARVGPPARPRETRSLTETPASSGIRRMQIPLLSGFSPERTGVRYLYGSCFSATITVNSYAKLYCALHEH